jgi:hypothetical protein
MTQTNTPPEPATVRNPRFNASDILMNLIVTLLAPMFLGVTAGDVALARMAATETVNAYRAQNLADLIAVAQIIAYGLAALGSLSLSMADDLSLAMTLRLRGNANACTRSAEQNRRALTQCFGDAPMPARATMAAEPEIPAVFPEDGIPAEAELLLNLEAAKRLADDVRASRRHPEQTAAQTPVPLPAPIAAATTTPTAAEKRNQEMWAIVMVKAAGEITASIPNLPPAERRAATIRAGAMTSAANELLTGVTPHAPSFGTQAVQFRGATHPV